MNIKRAVLIGSILFSFASGLPAQGPQPAPEAGVVLSRIEPLSPIIVPAKVFGENQSMIFDTGSSFHVLDQRYVKQLGPVTSKETVGASTKLVDIKLFSCPQISVGGFSLDRELPVSTFVMQPFSEAVGQHVDGLIGVQFLSGRVVELNFDDGQLVVHDKDSWKRDPNAISLSMIEGPETGSINTPVVAGVVGPYRLSLMVDTGFSGELGLNTRAFDELVKRGQLNVTRNTATQGLDGKNEPRTGVVDSFLLGAFRHESILVMESSSNLIGLRYLSRYNVVFDYDNKKVYLKEGNKFNDVMQAGKSGIGFLWVDQQVVVDSVGEGSPAETVGIRKADVIVKINGEAVFGHDFGKVRGILTQASGTVVDVQLLRKGQSFSVKMTLADF